MGLRWPRPAERAPARSSLGLWPDATRLALSPPCCGWLRFPRAWSWPWLELLSLPLPLLCRAEPDPDPDPEPDADLVETDAEVDADLEADVRERLRVLDRLAGLSSCHEDALGSMRAYRRALRTGS